MEGKRGRKKGAPEYHLEGRRAGSTPRCPAVATGERRSALRSTRARAAPSASVRRRRRRLEERSGTGSRQPCAHQAGPERGRELHPGVPTADDERPRGAVARRHSPGEGGLGLLGVVEGDEGDGAVAGAWDAQGPSLGAEGDDLGEERRVGRESGGLGEGAGAVRDDSRRND